jgi:hypothetical protein
LLFSLLKLLCSHIYPMLFITLLFEAHVRLLLAFFIRISLNPHTSSPTSLHENAAPCTQYHYRGDRRIACCNKNSSGMYKDLSMPFGVSRLRLKCDGTRAETRLRLSAKRMSQFKSAGASVQSTTGSRGVRISGSNAGYTMFRGSVKSTGYALHSPVSPSLLLPYVTVCHHISTGL